MHLGFSRKFRHETSATPAAKNPSRSRFLSALLAPLISFASIGCMPGSASAMVRPGNSFFSGEHGNEQPFCDHSNEQPICNVSFSKNSLTLSYAGKDGTFVLELDVPDAVHLTSISKVSCQADRTIIISDGYAIRSLGYDQLKIGKNMLGQFGNTFYVQNAVFLPLSPLGMIQSAEISDSLVVVRSARGTYRIDMDDPAAPARRAN